MPIYEYTCSGCGHDFELLVRPGDRPACPSCQGGDLDRRLSLCAVSSEASRQVSFNKARQAARRVQRDKDHAQMEYEKKHREEEGHH